MPLATRQQQEARLDEIAEQQLSSPWPLLFHLVMIGLFTFLAVHALTAERWVLLVVSLFVVTVSVNGIVWPRRRVRRAHADQLRGLP